MSLRIVQRLDGPDGAFAVALVFLVVLLLAMGVNVGVTLRYGLYEAAYVILPGAFGVSRRDRWLRARPAAARRGVGAGVRARARFVSVTAAAGARGVFTFYPLIAAAALAPPLAYGGGAVPRYSDEGVGEGPGRPRGCSRCCW